jgi:CspA family cold shock protein
MSTSKVSETPVVAVNSYMHTGRVKWFNNKAGYGFIAVSDGPYGVGKDVFVHHTNIVVSSEQYTYLIQGEYVHFKVEKTTDDSQHESHAVQVQGISGGKLMCETRYDFRRDRNAFESQKRGIDDTKSRDVGSEQQSSRGYTREPRHYQKNNKPQQQTREYTSDSYDPRRQRKPDNRRPPLQRNLSSSSDSASQKQPQPRVRGSGPRDGAEWKLVNKRTTVELSNDEHDNDAVADDKQSRDCLVEESL